MPSLATININKRQNGPKIGHRSITPRNAKEAQRSPLASIVQVSSTPHATHTNSKRKSSLLFLFPDNAKSNCAIQKPTITDSSQAITVSQTTSWVTSIAVN